MPDALLIAMSGVRIVNPELASLGLTLPGFIERGKVIASMPSLGLLSVADALPEHWQIVYREVDWLVSAGSRFRCHPEQSEGSPPGTTESRQRDPSLSLRDGRDHR